MIMLTILRVAYRALSRNKLRSLLTMLGIIIGVAAVITMVSIGQGAQYNIEQQIASLGTNLLVITPGAQSAGGISFGAGTSTRLTEDDAKAIREQVFTASYVAPVCRAFGQVIYQNLNWYTTIFGSAPEFFIIRDWSVESGAYFTDADVRAGAKVCVVGQTVSTNLFGEDGDPIGKLIRVRNEPFRIVGVLSRKGQNAAGQDQDDIIIAPLTTVMRRLQRQPFISQILVSAETDKVVQKTLTDIRATLRDVHHLFFTQDDDFTIKTQDDIAQTATQTSQVLTILLAAIASVSLVVGGIGIMNIMLVSVTERTREIGIRMSIGARGTDILLQFLIEAVVLSLLGGGIGIVIGVISSDLISTFAEWPTFVSVGSIFLAFGFSLCVGVFFGFYPARKASTLNPIDALRYE